MKKAYLLLLVAAMTLLGGCAKDGKITASLPETAPMPNGTIVQSEMPQEGEEVAVITTNQGEVRMRFFPDDAPKAVENFKTHAKEGYYDGLTFHRVIEGFMIQGGDPEGTGAGGESIWGEPFEDEISPRLHFFRGAVAMANAGPNTNGSQFFVVQNKNVQESLLNTIKETRDGKDKIEIQVNKDTVLGLNDLFPDSVLAYYKENGGTVELEYAFGKPYTIFAQVYTGLDVVDTIAATETDSNDKPVTDVIIEKIAFEPYSASDTSAPETP